MYDKKVQMTLLFDFYGQLLTPKQIKIMDMYYNEDFSLSEISEHLSISRQGVYDSLKRAENTLFEYEEKLGLLARFLYQKNSLDIISSMIKDILKYKDIDIMTEKLIDIREYIDKLL